MQSLQAFFEANGKRDIFTLAGYIEQHVNEYWEIAFQNKQREMLERYDEIGDSVYGLYGTEVFRHIHAQLKEVGWRATPRLPGNFNISREWGDDETDRQRWMWSKIATNDGEPIGTIATAFYHDHEQIRIPRAFRIIALTETSKGEVVKALSAISPDFKNALEARVEYAAYYADTDA